MHGCRSRAQKRDQVWQIEKLLGEMQHVDVGEQVDPVAQQHEDHGADAEPECWNAFSVRIEDDPKRHHHEEDGHRRVGHEYHLDQTGRLSLREDRLDRERPGEGCESQSRDEAIQDHAALRGSAHSATREAYEAKREQHVARQGDHVRNERPGRSQVTEGLESAFCRIVGQEEHERREQARPWPDPRRPPDADRSYHRRYGREAYRETDNGPRLREHCGGEYRQAADQQVGERQTVPADGWRHQRLAREPVSGTHERLDPLHIEYLSRRNSPE